MHRIRIRVIASPLLATTVAIGACGGGGTAGSSDGGQDGAPITTRDMYVSANVEAEDDATAEISVSLYDGKLFGLNFLLTGGDALRACVGTQCSPLIPEPSSTA